MNVRSLLHECTSSEAKPRTCIRAIGSHIHAICKSLLTVKIAEVCESYGTTFYRTLDLYNCFILAHKSAPPCSDKTSFLNQNYFSRARACSRHNRTATSSNQQHTLLTHVQYVSIIFYADNTCIWHNTSHSSLHNNHLFRTFQWFVSMPNQLWQWEIPCLVYLCVYCVDCV